MKDIKINSKGKYLVIFDKKDRVYDKNNGYFCQSKTLLIPDNGKPIINELVGLEDRKKEVTYKTKIAGKRIINELKKQGFL